MTQDPAPRRLLTTFEKFLLLLVVLVLLYYGARQCGFSPVQTTEETEIVDDPHPGY